MALLTNLVEIRETIVRFCGHFFNIYKFSWKMHETFVRFSGNFDENCNETLQMFFRAMESIGQLRDNRLNIDKFVLNTTNPGACHNANVANGFERP